jgi:hypothetical protein
MDVEMDVMAVMHTSQTQINLGKCTREPDYDKNSVEGRGLCEEWFVFLLEFAMLCFEV